MGNLGIDIGTHGHNITFATTRGRGNRVRLGRGMHCCDAGAGLSPSSHPAPCEHHAARAGSPRERRQRYVRDAILDSAVALFAAKSFEETTGEDIAATA